MRKKGASLIWAVVMSSALIYIAVTVSTFVVKESQSTSRLDDSARAYAAAESGIEWGKYCLGQTTIVCTGVNTFNIAGASYTVRIAGTTIESTGTFNSVNRKLETVVNLNAPLNIIDMSSGITIPGSYVQEFDYWRGSVGSGVQIGITDTEGTLATGDDTHKIYFEETAAGRIRLVTQQTSLVASQQVSTSSISVGPTGDITGAELSSAYAVRVRIEYKQDLMARMTVSKKNTVSNSPDYFCIPIVMIVDLRNFGMDFNNVTSPKKMYYSYNGAVVVPTLVTSGNWSNTQYSLSPASPTAFFDNMRGLGLQSRENLLTTSVPLGNGKIQVMDASGSYVDYSVPVRYYESQTAAIRAVPTTTGYRFVSWGGSCSGNVSSILVPMDVAKNCTASFSNNNYILNISPIHNVEYISGGIGTTDSTGTITVTPSASSYTYGTPLILTATAKTAHYFHNWTGDCSTFTGSTCTITMDGDKTVGAEFWTWMNFASGTIDQQYLWGKQSGNGVYLTSSYGTPDGTPVMFFDAKYRSGSTCRVLDWIDTEDAYITKRIYIPPGANYISFQANISLGTATTPFRDKVVAGFLEPWPTWLGMWGVTDSGAAIGNAMTAGRVFSGGTVPTFGGWGTYVFTIPANMKTGQSVFFYVRAHNDCWFSYIMIDNLKVY